MANCRANVRAIDSNSRAFRSAMSTRMSGDYALAGVFFERKRVPSNADTVGFLTVLSRSNSVSIFAHRNSMQTQVTFARCRGSAPC
jgi:hypothetical protein